ncbi:hypothetical protein C6P42_005361 [Pichia californica]|nr:hypothetical protein C6P42_005361 [[Candida] californica]
MVVLLDDNGKSIFDIDLTSDHEREKHINQMLEMLDANDIDRLRETVLCTSDGLLDNSVRKRAWPLLIGQDTLLDMHMKESVNIKEQDSKESSITRLKHQIEHKDAEQVLKDVERSFIYLNSIPDQQNSVENNLSFLRKRLNKLIIHVLNAIPGINYYQGYHDVASMVVLTFDNDYEAFRFLYNLTLRYLRDHMMTNISPTMKQLDLIPELLSYNDYDIYLILKTSKPVYALSAVISLFTHDITNINDISLIWDYIFACDDPQLVIYIYTALLIYYKDDILVDLNEMSDSSIESSTYDSDIVHVVLNNFIKTHLSENSIDSKLEVNTVLRLALDLKKKIPLSKLKSFKNISSFSFLKSKSTSITVLILQIKEQKLQDTKIQKKRYILKTLNNNSALIKREIHRSPMIIKASLGICILGIVMHTTLKNSGVKLGITNEVTRNIHIIWNCIKDNLR